MMTSATVSTAGLGLDILGVWLIFRHGRPPPDAAGDYLAISEASEDRAEKARKHHKGWARAGIGLITAGFALQGISNWLPSCR